MKNIFFKYDNASNHISLVHLDGINFEVQKDLAMVGVIWDGERRTSEYSGSEMALHLVEPQDSDCDRYTDYFCVHEVDDEYKQAKGLVLDEQAWVIACLNGNEIKNKYNRYVWDYSGADIIVTASNKMLVVHNNSIEEILNYEELEKVVLAEADIELVD